MKPIKRLVRSHVRHAALLSNVGAEISFQLPNDASASFEGMLTEIDARKAELKINRYDRFCICWCFVFCMCCVLGMCFVSVFALFFVVMCCFVSMFVS